jgi:hypothetical protein
MVETVDAGKNKVSRRAVVDAPVSELFDLVANPHRHHELDGSGTVGNIVSGAERMIEDEPFTMKMRQFGMNYSTTSIPTEVREDQVVEWQVAGRQKWRWDLRPLGPNSTEVTETWDVDGLWIAPIFRLTGMFGRNGKGIEETLKRLQARYSDGRNTSRFGG